MIISIFLKRFLTKNQSIRFLSTKHEDLINQPLIDEKPGYRNRLKLDNKALKRRIFSPNQTFEEQKECILTEMKMMEEEGIRVPTEISEKNWKFLVSEPNRIIGNLLYLSRKQYYKEKAKEIKLKKSSIIIEQIESRGEDEKYKTSYPGHNTFLRRVHINNKLNLLRAFTLNNPAVVFDFQFEEANRLASKKRSLIRQIMNAYGVNSIATDPFRMYFSNFKKDGKFDTSFKESCNNLDDLLIVNSEESYLKMFPKEKLVYLSPNAKYEMKEVDEDKVYIIGVLADEGVYKPYTYDQARLDGIRCERFPLDRYMNWSQGSKELTLDQVMTILVKLRSERSWLKALDSGVPKRKIHSNFSENFYKRI